MRFMLIVKASRRSEAGEMPDEQLIASMGKFNEEIAKAGILLDLGGLQASSKGARVSFHHSRATVTDGPFPDPGSLIAGYWLIRVNSKEEAVDWAKRAPAPHGAEGGEIEIRQLFELEDFGENPAIDRARKLEAKLPRAK